jgi:transcriptional activator of cad operon
MPIPMNNFKLSNLTLDIATQTLILNHHDFIQLKPQSFELLCYFCLNHHKIVSRDELIANVWHNRIVSDNAINRAVSQLRLAIAELDTEQEYIQTLPRAGYRLSVNVTNISSEATKLVSADTYASTDLQPSRTTHLQTKEPSEEKSGALKNVQSPATSTHLDIDSTDKNISTGRPILFVSLIFLLLVSMTLSWYWLFNDETHQQQQLLSSQPQTYAPGAEYDASISRDWIVYVNRNEHEFAVFASNKHNNEIHVVHKSIDAIRFPKLSPNVDLLSVFTRKNERLGLRHCQLNILRFHTAEIIKQYPCGLANVVTQRWLSSSRLQLVTATEGRGLKIINLDLSRNDPRVDFNIAFSDERLKFISVQISPDGKEVGLLSRNMVGNETHLNVFSISTQKVKQSIVLPGIAISAVQWLNDGDFMWLESGRLFKTNSEGLNRIEQMTDLNTITQLNDVYENEIFVSHGQTRMNLIRVDRDSKEVAQVVSSKDEFMPAYAHNSEQFVFFSNRTGRLKLWLNNSSNTSKKLKLPEQELLLKPIQWSPDDSHLIITTKHSILVYSLATEKILEINSHPFNRAFWLNNNELVILTKNSSDKLTIYDLLSGNERQLTLPFPIINAQASDEFLYFSQGGSNDIGRFNLKTQQVQKLGVKTNAELGLWKIKKDVLYYVPKSNDKLHVVKLDLNTGSELPIYYFNIADSPTFSISSLGHILLQRQVSDETDVSSLFTP